MVETAYDGPSAIGIASTFRPAFILLDIGLPGMDGYRVAERLRTMFDDRLVIRALSGYGRDQDRKRGKDAGFDHHLMKPVHIEEMLNVLRESKNLVPTA